MRVSRETSNCTVLPSMGDREATATAVVGVDVVELDVGEVEATDIDGQAHARPRGARPAGCAAFDGSNAIPDSTMDGSLWSQNRDSRRFHRPHAAVARRTTMARCPRGARGGMEQMRQASLEDLGDRSALSSSSNWRISRPRALRADTMPTGRPSSTTGAIRVKSPNIRCSACSGSCRAFRDRAYRSSPRAGSTSRGRGRPG